MTHPTRLTLLLVVAPLASVCAAAQTEPYTHDVSWPWPSSLGTNGTLQRTVCNDVTGDARPDVFVRGGANGDGITFFSGPGETAASWDLAPTCHDFDIAPKAGTDGLDALVFVDGNALKRLDFNPSTQDFDSPVQLSTTMHWQNTLLVRSADANASGAADYVGLKGTQTVAYRYDTGPGVFTEGVFSAGGIVKDIQFVRWFSGTTLSLAIRLSNGLEVRSLTGVALGTFTYTGTTTDAMAIVPIGGTLANRVALLSRSGGGDELLRTYKRTSLDPECSMSFIDVGGLVASSIAAGDMDGDGDYDLAVSWTQSTTLHTITNTAGVAMGPAYSSSTQTAVTWTEAALGTPLFPNQAQVIFRNVDNHSDPEASIHSELLIPLRNQTGSLVTGRLVCLKKAEPWRVDGGDCGAFPDAAPGFNQWENYEISISPGMPINGDDPAVPQESERYLEVVVWRQPVDDGYPTNPTDDEAKRKFLYPLLDCQPEPGNEYGNLRVLDIETESPSSCGVEAVRFIEFREVFANEDGSRTYLAGPTFTVAVTGDDGMQIGYGELNGCHYDHGGACELGGGDVQSFVRPRRTNTTGSPILPPAGTKPAIAMPEQ